MKILVLILLAFLTACEEAPEVQLLKEARADAVLMQSSNSKLASDMTMCSRNLSGTQDRLSSVCQEVETLMAKQLTQEVEVSKGSEAEVCGVLAEVTKMDSSGWVYLKYTAGESVRYSDRLWFKGKTDRNSLLVHTEGSPVLLSVLSCETTCRVQCRVLLEGRNVCEEP